MDAQFSLDTKIKVGIIGFGRMGRFYWEAMRKSGRWEIAYICDTDPTTRELAKKISPESRVVENDQKIFEDESVQVVGLFTLADSRLEQIEKAIRYGKHIIAEKPVADTMEKEWKVVDMIENSNVLSTVNLYLRNSWYHNLMKEYIQKGEIGELAIIRICHMTPGLAPGEGHEYEGPAFHDCGMHYVDIVRWYAESEYRTWNAQGVNMWNYKDPWWVQCHGTFQNGAKTAEERGVKVIIAGAGKAAHLPGMCAALFPMPVIGIPMKTSDLGGVDSLYSIVQMPSGIPVATVAINGGKNAGILAAKILAASDPELLSRLKAYSEKMKNEVVGKAEKLDKTGYKEYLASMKK